MGVHVPAPPCMAVRAGYSRDEPLSTRRSAAQRSARRARLAGEARGGVHLWATDRRTRRWLIANNTRGLSPPPPFGKPKLAKAAAPRSGRRPGLTGPKRRGLNTGIPPATSNRPLNGMLLHAVTTRPSEHRVVRHGTHVAQALRQASPRLALTTDVGGVTNEAAQTRRPHRRSHRGERCSPQSRWGGRPANTPTSSASAPTALSIQPLGTGGTTTSSDIAVGADVGAPARWPLPRRRHRCGDGAGASPTGPSCASTPRVVSIRSSASRVRARCPRVISPAAAVSPAAAPSPCNRKVRSSCRASAEP